MMTLDGTCTYLKVFEKCLKKAGKIRGKIIFPPRWFLINKLDQILGLHAKNQREISKTKLEDPATL